MKELLKKIWFRFSRFYEKDYYIKLYYEFKKLGLRPVTASRTEFLVYNNISGDSYGKAEEVTSHSITIKKLSSNYIIINNWHVRIDWNENNLKCKKEFDKLSGCIIILRSMRDVKEFASAIVYNIQDVKYNKYGFEKENN